MRSASARLALAGRGDGGDALAGAIAGVAQLNFTSTDFEISGDAKLGGGQRLNGDSHLDLATANNGALFDDGGVEVLLGAGDGTFNDTGEGDDTLDGGRGKGQLDGTPGADRLTDERGKDLASDLRPH
jgi:hypothetical protein